MTENKRFTLAYETNDQNGIWWAVRDGDVTLWKEEVVGLLNELHDENEQLKDENEYYKSLFSKIVETALTDKNCREEWCKAILNIFDKANSLNQAREMIQARLK